MLVSFTVGNYRSFKEPVTLSMEVEPRLKGKEDTNFVTASDGRKLLNAAAIYGANASGKSNLLKAMEFMFELILNSSKKTQIDDSIDAEPFLLDPTVSSEPSIFEIVLIIDKIEYTYGFKVTVDRVQEEWLYYRSKRTTVLFDRKGSKIQQINKKRYGEGLGLEKRTRKNALFLSVCSQFNGKISGKIIEKIDRINFSTGRIYSRNINYTKMVLKKKDQFAGLVCNYISKLDLSIVGLKIVERDIKYKPDKNNPALDYFWLQEKLKGDHVHTIHKMINGDEITFSLEKHESHGTQKIVELIGPLLFAIVVGTVIVIDEMETRLHPLLTYELLKMFQTDKLNSNGAQIIFTTHDSNLISQRVNLFRRDQIWFTEKRKDQSSDLYCLAEYNIRNDEAYDINYLRGRYGAVPFLGGLASLLGNKNG